MDDDLLKEMLETPVGPAIKTRDAREDDFTRKVEVTGDRAVVEVRGDENVDNTDAARRAMLDHGQNPDEWEVSGFRAGEWTMPNGSLGKSIRYTFTKRRVSADSGSLSIDELLASINSNPEYSVALSAPSHWSGQDETTFIVAIGDMQFGKVDGDGAAGTLKRTIACIDRAWDKYLWLRDSGYQINHVHIAWLGDHIEGFQSQGGALAWRTNLTLTEQIRLTRRVMLHALLVFAPVCKRLTMAAVPGNHGEAVRFNGKGVTRYDDSHDTEALIAVADAAALYPQRFGHVEFFVPENDELTVVVDCSGTTVAHAHGHQWNPNKHFEWWKGQAFNRASAMHMADLLLAGHLHHEHIESDGPRTFIGVPSMESESTWFRHRTGTAGAPGLLVALTSQGRTPYKEVIYGD